jgi:hypothetical protein
MVSDESVAAFSMLVMRTSWLSIRRRTTSFEREAGAADGPVNDHVAGRMRVYDVREIDRHIVDLAAGVYLPLLAAPNHVDRRAASEFRSPIPAGRWTGGLLGMGGSNLREPVSHPNSYSTRRLGRDIREWLNAIQAENKLPGSPNGTAFHHELPN